MFWDVVPAPNNEHAIGTRRPVEKKKKKKKKKKEKGDLDSASVAIFFSPLVYSISVV